MALVTASIIVIAIGLLGLLVYRFIKQSTRGKLWDFACISLVAGLVAQSTVLVNPAAEWVLPAVNASGVLIVGAVMIACRYINGRPIRRWIITILLLAPTIAAATAFAGTWGRSVDASIPTSLVVGALMVASARQCWTGRLRQIREARILAGALLIATASLPLWVVASYVSGPTPYFGAGLSTVAVLTLVPIGGISLLASFAVVKLDERDVADASSRIFLGAKAFQLAVLERADAPGGMTSLTLVLTAARVNDDENFLQVTRTLAEGLGPHTLVGAFNRSALIVASNRAPDDVATLIRRLMATPAGPLLEVQATRYSVALLAELTNPRAHSPGLGTRM